MAENRDKKQDDPVAPKDPGKRSWAAESLGTTATPAKQTTATPAKQTPGPAKQAAETPAKQTRETEERSFLATGLFWSMAAGVTAAIMLIVLIVQNTERVAVEFLGFDWSTPLVAVILVSLLIGIILDEAIGVLFRRRRRRVKQERQELDRLRRKRG